ncbi:MAG: LysR family transcriptional regulator [Bacilli bacterium]
MTLRHMKIFVTVSKFNSITKAAENLYISQPAVSCAIKELEDYYNIKLFDRISNRIYLTDSGKNFLDYAIHIVSLFDEMEIKVRNLDKTGRLRIGSSITIGTNFMPVYVNNYKAIYPQTEVYVTIDSSDIIEKKLLQNELDFALIEGAVHLDSIICENYMEDELVIICRPDHKLCKSSPVLIDQFILEPFLLREKGSGTRELFDNVLASLGYSVIPTWESTSTLALINAVISGVGISVLPYMLVKEKLNDGQIATIKIDGLKFNRKFNIIYHKNKFLTTAAKAFIEMCKEIKENSSPNN